jgi:hypothetical protein
MDHQSHFLLSTQDIVVVYAALIDSLDTIWNNYVFVLIGMVGWIVARAHEFQRVQKILITIVFSAFNSVIIFYFHDAYNGIGTIRRDLLTQKESSNSILVDGGIGQYLISFSPESRFNFVATLVGSFWVFVLFLVWSKRIWPHNNGNASKTKPSDLNS